MSISSENETIIQQLITVLQEFRPSINCLPEMVHDLKLDEIDMIGFVIEVEDAFDIHVDDEIFFKCEKFDCMINYILQCKKAKNL